MTDENTLGWLQFHAILSSPHLYATVTLSSTPPPPPALLVFLPRVLRGTRHLALPGTPAATLQYLISILSPRLTSLDLRFSSITDSMLHALAAAGALANVRELNVKGCRDVLDWASLSRRVPRLERLDLGWSGVATLPGGEEPDGLGWPSHMALGGRSGDENGWDVDRASFGLNRPHRDAGSFHKQGLVIDVPPFPSLQHLSLSTTPFLSTATLASFLAHLPPTLHSLDLSHLGLLPHILDALLHPRNFTPAKPSTLTSLDLRGNDAFTLRDIRRLEHAWLALAGRELEIAHSAVLESDDEEDVRKFVEMVAGARAVVG